MNTKLSNPVEYNLVNLLLNLSRSLDFSNVGIMDHHKKVAFIALNLGHKAGLSDQQLMELFKAAILHDIGAVNHRDKIILQKFDVNKPWAHCEKGSRFVAGIPDFDSARLTIFCHHDKWAGGNPSGLTGSSIPLNSRIIHLADRVDVLINHERYILEQNNEILQRIGRLSGKVFDPELFDILLELGNQESFWLDLVSPWIEDCMLELIPTSMASVRRDNLMTVARLFARVVDDRSSFTYRHSVYVGQVCRVLAPKVVQRTPQLERCYRSPIAHETITHFCFEAQGEFQAVAEKAGRCRPIHRRQMRRNKRIELQLSDLLQALEIYVKILVVRRSQQASMYVVLRHASSGLWRAMRCPSRRGST